MSRHLLHLLVETVQTRKFAGKGATALDLQRIQQIGQPDGTLGVVTLTIPYRMGNHPDTLEDPLIAGGDSLLLAVVLALETCQQGTGIPRQSQQNQAAQQGGQHPSTHHFFFGSGLGSG